MTKTKATIGFLVLTLLATASPAAGPTGKSPGGSGNPNTAQSQSPGGAQSSNAPFESTMLAYGALDEAMRALGHRACIAARGVPADKARVVVIDQASLANLAAYDSFYTTARFLEISFASLANLAQPAAAGGGTDTFADITNAVAAVLIAGTTDTSSTITIQDVSAALKVSASMKGDVECHDTEIAYPGLYGGDLTDFEQTLQSLSAYRNSALTFVVDQSDAMLTPAFNTLDASYNQFLQSSFAINGTTGQSGLGPIVQGYGLRKLLQSTDRRVYEVYVNVAAAGGTQRVRKNVLTSLVTGDWISYSGGVIVNTMILKKSAPSEVLYADVLRYRTPLTHIRAPMRKNSGRQGDNLNNTCPDGNDACKKTLTSDQ